jgi:hypothetical protein
MPLYVGDKLGPYEVVAPIGAGSIESLLAICKAFDRKPSEVLAGIDF